MGDTEGASLAGVVELLKTMLEERKQRDEEEERRREQERRDREEERKLVEAEREKQRQEREEERKRAEAEKEQERQKRMEEIRQKDEADRRQREEEWRQRDKELRVQMELLAKIAEVKKAESTETSKTGDNDLRVVKLTDRDDIEAYLTTFERLMTAYNIPRNQWIFKLAPQLTGKAQQAYAALTTEDALIYNTVKAAILRRYDITEETYLQRFQSAVRSNEETHRDLAIRLGDLATKWLKGVYTVELVKEAGAAAKHSCTLNPSVARKQTAKDDQTGKPCLPAPGTKPDHSQHDKEEGETSHPPEKRPFRSGQRRGDYLSTVTCYNCGKQGHVATSGGRNEGEVATRKGRCAHGDNVLYPVANVNLVVDGVPLVVEAAVSKSLPLTVLLGTDVPELAKFVGGNTHGARRRGYKAWMVVTRAAARKQEEEGEIQLQKEEDSQVNPNPVMKSAVDQLVLPTQCRKAVLQLAHEVPIAGHLGKHKTAKRILHRFYWPTLYRDVEDFCRGCQVCQKLSKQKVVKAPLILLPVVTEPFRRVAMDIVGPMPRTNSGNRYILVMSDYATRYPEAVPVKAIDAEHIAEELVRVFARVGIPEEILTDQGSNFTSQLLSEIYQLLHVHPIQTTPYHPQTDSLVERFNQTLTAMLRKVAVEDHLNWDKWLPFLLFAYREVPQDSTGFSPFELLYGRAVRRPLDILKETWREPKKCSAKVMSYVLAVQEKLASMSDLVKENMSKAQLKQKLCATPHICWVTDDAVEGTISGAPQDKQCQLLSGYAQHQEAGANLPC
ncbi:hypothetical protein EMCRGX_G022956 [Ephydatia muelleri]